MQANRKAKAELFRVQLLFLLESSLGEAPAGSAYLM
jgi:hypothetical protein